MSGPEGTLGRRVPHRKEDEVRRMLDTPHPPTPPELAERAMERGRRMLRRRLVLHVTLWALLATATVVGVVLAVKYWPQPTTLAPPMRGW